MAMNTFSTEVKWEQTGVLSTAHINKHKVVIDEPPLLGGTDKGPNPVEYLLAALGGCINVLVVSFAEKFDVEVKDLKVEVEGDLNPEGFLGKDPEARIGFDEIRYTIHLDSPSQEENIDALIAHVEKYCPVKDTLTGTRVVRQDLLHNK